jgi:hypothetical protein
VSSFKCHLNGFVRYLIRLMANMLSNPKKIEQPTTPHNHPTENALVLSPKAIRPRNNCRQIRNVGSLRNQTPHTISFTPISRKG